MPYLNDRMIKDVFSDPRIRTIYVLSRTVMGEDPVHGWPHIERVLGLSLRIAGELEEQVSYRVLIVSVLLHDIGRVAEEHLGEHHALMSARIAKNLLESMGYTRDFVDKVVEVIKAHSYSLGGKPKSIEAMILSDADKLDAMGAIGIARTFMLGERWKRGINGTVKHFHEKLLKLKDTLYLEPSRRIAERRHRVLEEFLRELEIDLEESKLGVKFIEHIDHRYK